jgi:lipopolysaccharide export system protein LptA
MRLTIQRLRWGLLAGALLLVVVLAGYIGYGRYRALRTYSQLLQRNGITITHETDGYTYSQSLKGKTVFTIHAAKAVQLSDNQYALHDAVMTFYGSTPETPDHVYGSEIEYDQKQGIARAQGEVTMDLHAPRALTGSAPQATAGGKDNDATAIHVRTSGLVYLRKLGMATTDQPVEFRYGGVQCTARGAEFNTDQSTLRLLADVQLTGDMHGQPVQMTASSATMDRSAETATLARPSVTSLGRAASADSATVTLRSDGSIDHVQAASHVLLRSQTLHAGAQQVTADRLDATMSPDTVPQTARLSGGVVLTDSNPLRPVHGSAAQVEMAFNSQGAPSSVTATGEAKVAMVDKRSSGLMGAQGLNRNLEAAKIVATFAPGPRRTSGNSVQLRQVTATGAAMARSESPVASPNLSLKSTLVSGDQLQLDFAAGAGGRPQPQVLHGSGHTLLQQDAPLNEQQSSSGDSLEIAFAAAKPAAKAGTALDEFAISTAAQTGHVSIRDHAPDRAGTKSAAGTPGAVSTGSAERATYDGATQKLTLTGNAHLSGDDASLTAQTVVMDRQSNVAEAFGEVRATLESGSTGAAKPADTSTHVLAASARFEHATKVAIFRGTDAQPARLWQQASQVQAANLLFDGEHHTFSARPAATGGMIHAVFAGTPTEKPANPAGARPAMSNVVRVTSPTMDYNDLQREAVFSGGVALDGTLGEVRSQRMLVYLTAAQPGETKRPAQPSPTNGSLDRVVVLGSVELEQPGRHGTGEQLVYTAASGNFVLTGNAEHRPMVQDAQQGSVTGTTLTFGASGSTIVVAGEPGATAAKHARVRTETEVRQ